MKYNKISIGILIGLLVGLLINPVSLFGVNPIKLIINNRTITCDVPPQNINGRVMVPARYVAEALGATVTWDSVNSTVNITSIDRSGNSDSILNKDANQNPQSVTSNSSTINDPGIQEFLNDTTPPAFTQEESDRLRQELLDSFNQTQQSNASSITKEQYNEFKNMFTVGNRILNSNGGDLSTKVTYSGSLNETDFFGYWNSMGKSTRDEMAKRFGSEIQALNPSLDIAIDFWFKDTKLGYVLAYSNKTQLCSFLDNPQLKQDDIK